MADKIQVDVEVNDKGSTKKAALNSKKLGEGLERTAKGARTADRNLKGAAQASANGTKNFAKMSQGISGGIVPAYAVLAANVFAISAAFNFLKKAADLSALQASQGDYAKSTGLALESVTNRLRDASNGMLGFKEAAEAAAIGSAKGFSSAQLEDLAVGATKVSKALGRDFTDSFDRLVRGISKAEPELLDELGITLRLEKATTDYATSIGKNVKALTDQERSQAVLVAVQKQLNDQFGEVEGAANPFTKLAKTFEDITKTITEFFLPAFSSIASMISNNAGVAFAFFAILAAGIIKSMPGFDGLAGKITDFADDSELAMMQAEEDLGGYRDALDATIEKMKEAAEADKTGYASAKGDAQGDVEGLKARKGSGLEKLQGGEDVSSRQLSAMIKSAKAGTGEYKNLTDERREHLISSLEDMEKAAEKMEGSTISAAQKATIGMKKLGIKIRTGPARAMIYFRKVGANAMRVVGRAAALAGKAINLAMKFGGVIAVITAITSSLKALMDSPATFVNNIYDMAGSVLQTINQLVTGMVEGLLGGYNWIRSKLGLEDVEFEVPLVFNEENLAKWKTALNDTSGMKFLQGVEDKATNRSTFLETLEKITDVAKDVNKELAKINEGITKEGVTNVQASLKRMTAINSVGISSMVKAAQRDSVKVDGTFDPVKYKKATDAIVKELGPNLKELSPVIYDALFKSFDEGFKAIEDEEKFANKFVNLTKKAKDDIDNITKSLGGGDLYNLLGSLEPMTKTVTLLDEMTVGTNLVTDAVANLDEALKGQGGIDKFRTDLENLIAAKQNVKLDTIDLGNDKRDAGRAPAIVAAQMKLRIDFEEKLIALRTLNNTLQEQRMTLTSLETDLSKNTDSGAIEKLNGEIEVTKAKIAVQKAGNAQAKKDMTAIGQVGDVLGESLSNNLASAFDAIVQGTKSAKEAFKDMAMGILKSLAQIITKLLVVKLLETALGGSTFGDFIGITGKKDGGIMSNGVEKLRYGGVAKSKNYSSGGVATGRDAGYPAILHGTEAVVPLPNNRSIPVDLGGQAGQNNMVTVNVSMDGQGGAKQETSSNGEQAKRLGEMVASAVQEELQYQKRSGGILNPYGVA